MYTGGGHHSELDDLLLYAPVYQFRSARSEHYSVRPTLEATTSSIASEPIATRRTADSRAARTLCFINVNHAAILECSNTIQADFSAHSFAVFFIVWRASLLLHPTRLFIKQLGFFPF